MHSVFYKETKGKDEREAMREMGTQKRQDHHTLDLRMTCDIPFGFSERERERTVREKQWDRNFRSKPTSQGKTVLEFRNPQVKTTKTRQTREKRENEPHFTQDAQEEGQTNNGRDSNWVGDVLNNGLKGEVPK